MPCVRDPYVHPRPARQRGGSRAIYRAFRAASGRDAVRYPRGSDAGTSSTRPRPMIMRRKRLLPTLPFLLLGLLTTIVLALILAATVDVQQGRQLQAQSFGEDDDWTVSRWDRAGAVLIHSQRS